MQINFGTDPGIATWATGLDIISGIFYEHEDNLYKANTSHTAGASFDLSKFDIIGSYNTSSFVDVEDATPVTVTTDQTSVQVDASNGNATVNMYTAASNRGKKVNIRKTDSSSGTVTITPDGAETIDGLSSIVLYNEGENVTLVSNNTNWYTENSVRIVKGTAEPTDTSVFWLDTN